MALAIRMRSSSMVRALAGPPRHTPPDALWLYILALLEPRDLCAAGAVSRAWHRMAFALLQTPHYWRSRCGLTRAQYVQYLDLRRQMRARTRTPTPGTVVVTPLPSVGSGTSSTASIPADTPRLTVAVQGLPGAGKSAFIRAFCERALVSDTSAITTATSATTKGRALVRTESGAAVEVVLVEVPPDARDDAVWRAADATVVLCDAGGAAPDAAATAAHFAGVWRARAGAQRAGAVVLAASRCDVRTSWHFAAALALHQHAAVARLPCFETSAAASAGADAPVLHLCAPLLARHAPPVPTDSTVVEDAPPPVLGTPPLGIPPLGAHRAAADECRLM